MAKIDQTRLSVFDLPGELRNEIYSYLVLSFTPPDSYLSHITPHGLPLILDPSKASWLPEGGRRNSTMHGLMHNLNALSLVSTQIRHEARAFFFGRNDVCLFAKGPCRMAEYTQFLKMLGRDGCERLTFLALLKFYGTFGTGSRKMYDGFFRALEACVKLREVQFSVHLEYFLPTSSGDVDGLKSVVTWETESLICGDSSGDGNVSPPLQLDLGGLAHSLGVLAQHGSLNRIIVKCRYGLPWSDPPRCTNEQMRKWEYAFKMALTRELRVLLPDGFVHVKVRDGKVMDR